MVFVCLSLCVHVAIICATPTPLISWLVGWLRESAAADAAAGPSSVASPIFLLPLLEQQPSVSG